MAASNPNLTSDLHWLLQALRHSQPPPFPVLHTISFFLSQPSSDCVFFSETQTQTQTPTETTSLTINISDASLPTFSHLLSALVSDALRTLEFHRAEWRSDQIRALTAALHRNPSVRHLRFIRNRFDPDCLSELSGFLKRGTAAAIKEVEFSESGIGAAGAAILAAGLRTNGSVVELQICEDSIGTKGAEELSKTIEVNPTLKKLTIFDSNHNTAIPLISAVLARNRATEVHVWCGESQRSKVVEFVPETTTLRIYFADFSGTCRIACALGLNTTVSSLDMTGVKLKSRWAKEFRWVLEQNQTLKEAILSDTCLKDKGAVYLAAGLFKNHRLKTLHLDGNRFGGVGVEHLLCPLSRFSTLQLQANTTLKCLTLGGRRTAIGRNGLASILTLLTTNQSLTRFGIHDDQSLRREDIAEIFRSLESNASLRFLSLQGCRGVRGDMVLEAILNLLEVNPWIEDIDLSRTPLEGSEKTERIYQKLSQNGQSMEPDSDIDVLKDMALAVPKSCRVFFCGQEYAGKATLYNSVSQNFSLNSKLPYLDQVRTLVGPVEQAVRTVGMKIKTFKDEDTKISMWNLAGQHECCALHDIMFPGYSCPPLFLIICSLFRKPNNKEPKTAAEVEEELQYWLRFIVSNSSRASQQCILPNVTVVLTHFDKIVQPSQNLHATVDLIQKLRDKFQGFVDFYPTVFTVDARSSSSVSKLVNHLRKTSKMILQRVPQVYELCNDLMKLLCGWRSENYNKPIIKWKEFSDLCQVKIPFLRVQSRHDNREKVEMRRQAISNSLHGIGEVIYFKELGLLILDYEWFFGEVLCHLLRLDLRKQGTVKDGFISWKELEKVVRGNLQSQILGMGPKVFEYLNACDLIRMMLRLEVCYQQDPSNPNSSLLIPSALEEAKPRPQWELSRADCLYVGRHFTCDDSSHMSLTPNFFPRLQVHLHNILNGLTDQHGATYSLEKYLISISINGIYMRVEFGLQMGYHIDILACSTKNLTETLRLFQQLIIPEIHSLCSGITLIESILRPECVRDLTPPRYRKSQYVHLQHLKEALLSVPADFMYDYQHTWDQVLEHGRTIMKGGFDLVRDLLSDDDFRDVLHRRYNDLHNLAEELQVPQEENAEVLSNAVESDAIEPTFGGIAKGVELVLQRLKIIEQEIRDVKLEIQGLRYYEHRLLMELNQKVNFLVTYNVQVEERKAPNMFYFARTENYVRRLVTNIVSGMTAVRLHMLCEFRGEMHVVADQLGCEVMQVDNRAVNLLAPYTKKFMTLLTMALRIGAQFAGGLAGMIPDLGRDVAYLMDSTIASGAAGAVAAGALGAAAMGRTRDRAGDIQQDLRTAQQWVMDFLRDHDCSSGKDIAEKFGLWRVRYRDSGQIAWVCRRHMKIRAFEIIEVPV